MSTLSASLRNRGIAVTVRLEPEAHQALQTAANRRGLSVTAYCREVLEQAAGSAPDDSPAALRKLTETVLRELIKTRVAAVTALCLAKKQWAPENLNTLNFAALLADDMAGTLVEDALANKPLDLQALIRETVFAIQADDFEAKQRDIKVPRLYEADQDECSKPESQRAELRPADLQFRRYKKFRALASQARASRLLGPPRN